MSKALEILVSMIPVDETVPGDQVDYLNECSHESLEEEGHIAELEAMDVACGVLDKLNFICSALDDNPEMGDSELRGYATAFECAVNPLSNVIKENVELSMERRKESDPTQTKAQAFRERLMDNIGKVVDKIVEFVTMVYRKAKGFITKRFSAGARLSKRLNKMKGEIKDLPQYPKSKEFTAVLPSLRSSAGQIASVESISNWLNVMTKFDPMTLAKPFMDQVVVKPTEAYEFMGKTMQREKFEMDFTPVELAINMIDRMEGALSGFLSGFGLKPTSSELLKSLGVKVGKDTLATLTTPEMPGRYIMYVVSEKGKLPSLGVKRLPAKEKLDEATFDTLGKDQMTDLIDECTAAIMRSYDLSNDINDAINAIGKKAKDTMRIDKSTSTKVINSDLDNYKSEKVKSHYNNFLRGYVSQAAIIIRRVIALYFSLIRGLSGFVVSIGASVEEYVGMCIKQYEGGSATVGDIDEDTSNRLPNKS